MNKKSAFKVGDVFEIELEEGMTGYGRVLKIEDRTVFVELYKIDTNKDSIKTVADIVKFPVILSVWCTDNGFRKKIWNVIGNACVTDEVVMPDFWKRDAINRDKYFIVRGEKTFEVSKDEIGDAQPFGIFGHDAVRLRYAHELKSKGLV